MINIRGLINRFILSKPVVEGNDEYEECPQVYDEHLTESIDKSTFEQLICFFVDGKQEAFPVYFAHKDEYLKKGRIVYESIGVENYIKKIKIMNNLLDAGQTKIEIQDDKVEIIISISSSKLGIGSGGGVREFTEEQCTEFADVLAHELFHAKNNIDIIEYVGIEEYKSIRYLEDIWFKLARIMFDEYCACRKNAEKFNSFESVESEETVERIFNYLQSLYKDPRVIVAIEKLFYSIATISAFADVSNEKEGMILENLKNSKKLFQEVRAVFNCFYLESPLDFKKYKDMAGKLEQIYNSYELRGLN